jgi:YVTN family beta-propeller protein
MRIAIALLTVALSAAASCSAEAPATGPLEPLSTIALPGVSGRIDHLAADVKGNRLFVAALGHGTVEVIDLAAGKVAQTITGLKEPQGILFAAELNLLVVACGGDGSVRFYDGATLKPLGTLDYKEDADNLRYDAAAKRIYVGYGSGALGVIDAAKREKVGEVLLAGHPESFQLEKGGKRIFVNVPTAGHVAVVDREKPSVLAPWPVAGAKSNFPMALDEASRRLFVVCRKPAEVLVFDTGSGKIATRFECAGDADDIFYDAPVRRLYLSGGQGFVEAFEQADADHYRLIQKVPTAWMARTALFVPDLARLFVAAPHMVPLEHEAEVRVFKVGR